ncbi:uncharacterized protein BN697_01810 [Bacteroides sp. CAG:530]|nr:uncharacterized protein BN697_01810 [Bacteroides sp. CAG:530]
MIFKYLSLFLCLSLFACSDDENIPTEEKPTTPQGEPMEDTPIVQKDYISNPSLWTGPSLSNDGFVVEIEMGAESSVRSTERTKKSIDHYNMGVYQSPLPEIRAAEWGYTVLNLHTGQIDGAGRKINNIYLDNMASINDRKTALETIMRFVKTQYRVEDGITPWYSMNGHHCWHHYAGATGATVLASEIGENIHGYQLHIAMNRGAARQYNKPWVIDFSSWHGASILDYSKTKIWKEYSGAKYGHSINLVERSMLMSYMAGADGVVAEGGGAICFYDDITTDDHYKLSPYGKVFQKLYQFSKANSNVGITYTPFAVLLDQFHGMDRQPSGQQAFGKFGYNQGDMETFNLIETLWPQTFSVEKNGNEIGAMVNSKYPDAVDFLLQGASLDMLKTYKAVMLSGDIQLTPAQIADLRSYAAEGGVVLASDRHLDQLSFNGTGDTAIREEKVGKGKIVGFDSSALKDILNEYLKEMLPIEVEGDVEYFVNVADGAFYVTLINNDGVMKSPKTPVQFDSSKRKDIVINYKAKNSIQSVEELWNSRKVQVEGRTIKFRMLPGDCYILKIASVNNY